MASSADKLFSARILVHEMVAIGVFVRGLLQYLLHVAYVIQLVHVQCPSTREVVRAVYTN